MIFTSGDKCWETESTRPEAGWYWKVAVCFNRNISAWLIQLLFYIHEETSIINFKAFAGK